MIYGFSSSNDRIDESSKTSVKQNVFNQIETATNYTSLDAPNAGPIPEGIQSVIRPPFTDVNFSPDMVETAFAFQTYPSPTNFVTFPIPGYTTTNVGSHTFADFASAGVFAPNGTFFLTTAGDATGTSQLYRVNTTTGVPTLVGNFTGAVTTNVNGIAYDPTTGIFYVTTSTTLATLDTNTGSTTLVGNYNLGGSSLMVKIVVDCDGKMYGIDLGLDNTYLINKTNATPTLLGPLGFNLNFGCGATFDKENDIFYLLGLDGNGNINALRTINTTTGAATTVHTWNPTLSQFAPFDIVGNVCPSGPPPVGNKFVDSLNGANDTTALKSRGYLVYYRGTGPQGTTATWFQGNETVFPAFNGPPTGYVAANFNAVTGMNDIDSWLVLPALNIVAGDTISFWEQGAAGSWPDSMRVMYSASGDSTPEGSWVELGRFKNTQGSWANRIFMAPAPGSHARFAIRYCVVDGGPSGNNSNYLGVDYIQVNGTIVGVGNEPEITADQYSLSQNYPNPFNPVTKINFSIPQSGFVSMKVYDAMGREVATLVSENKTQGTYTVKFNGADFSSGVYFVRMQAGDFSQVRRMVLVK